MIWGGGSYWLALTTIADRTRYSAHVSSSMKGTTLSTLLKSKGFWGINPWFPLLWAKIHPTPLWFSVLIQLWRMLFQTSFLPLVSISLWCLLLTYYTNLSLACGRLFLHIFSAYWIAWRTENYMNSIAGAFALMLVFKYKPLSRNYRFSDIDRYLHLEGILFDVFQEIRQKWRGWQLTILKIFSKWVWLPYGCVCCQIAIQCALPVFENLLPEPHNSVVLKLLYLLWLAWSF